MKTLRRSFILTLLAGVLLLILNNSVTSEPTIRDGLNRLTAGETFNFVDWTLDALFRKAIGASLKAEKFLGAGQQAQVMREYVRLVSEKANLEVELTQLVAEPGQENLTAISDTKQKLDRTGAYLTQYSHLAESTLQTQTEQMLLEMGFGFGGQILPPVLYHVSELPLNLIVSPRDVIQAEHEISLKAGLDTLQKEELENAVLENLDRSALIEPIGGMGAYPTMVMRTSDLAWLADTVAHEWGHNWLTFHPLGIRYFDNPQMKTINETATSIIGREVSLEILKQWYPELVPPSTIESGEIETPVIVGPVKEVFNFRREMRETRMNVDEMLSKGSIIEAEVYMEKRRTFFWENGYRIRKINQAYFAFYGSYNDIPGGGAAGNDPVGPAVQTLRAKSASLYVFVDQIQHIRSYEELSRLVSE
ncbi:MAG: hypothetical protein WBI14_00610 [Anaerolineaceae bacterium]